MRIVDKIRGILAAPDKVIGSASVNGEFGYDTTTNKVWYREGGTAKNITDSTAGITSGETMKVIRGRITGTTGAIAGGTGFTCTRNSAGVYTITFTAAFTAIPSITATALSSSAGDCTLDGPPSTTSTQVRTFVGTTATDRDFHFIAIGPR